MILVGDTDDVFYMIGWDLHKRDGGQCLMQSGKPRDIIVMVTTISACIQHRGGV